MYVLMSLMSCQEDGQVSHLNNDFLWEGPGKMSDNDEDVLSDASKSDLANFLSKVDEIGR